MCNQMLAISSLSNYMQKLNDPQSPSLLNSALSLAKGPVSLDQALNVLVLTPRTRSA